jgi:hypothetical protein
MKNVFLLCFSLGAALAGCGVSVTTSSTNPDSYEGYLKATSQLSCESQERCCGTTCAVGNDMNFLRNSTRTIEFIGLGLLRYDAAAAAECLSYQTQRLSVCDKPTFQLPKQPAACGKVIVPNTQAGGMCDSTIGNCVAETVCRSGTCIAAPTVGQACATSAPVCISTAYCDSLGGNVCRALPTGGQACSMPSNLCATGFYCDGTTRLCTPNGQSGQACSGVRPCDTTAGLVCLSNSTCGLPQPDGSPCTSPDHCQSARCSGLVAGSTCQPQLSPPTLRQQLCGLR